VNTPVQQRLEEITDLIVDTFDPERIILFGSYAYGHPTPNSDVDLLVIMESEDRPLKRSAQISKLLQPRPFPMDILVRTPDEIQHRLNIGDLFIQDVMGRGKVLYERGVSTRVDSQSRRGYGSVTSLTN
jgi:predicted nucleotidyltransferase